MSQTDLELFTDLNHKLTQLNKKVNSDTCMGEEFLKTVKKYSIAVSFYIVSVFTICAGILVLLIIKEPSDATLIISLICIVVIIKNVLEGMEKYFNDSKSIMSHIFDMEIEVVKEYRDLKQKYSCFDLKSRIVGEALNQELDALVEKHNATVEFYVKALGKYTIKRKPD